MLHLWQLIPVVLLVGVAMAGDITGHSMSPSKSSSRSQISRAVALEAKQLLTSENVIILNSENFENFVNDPTKFSVVLFHATWSGRSNKFVSDYVTVAEKYKETDNIQFGVLDANENEEISRRWEVTHFPALKLITRGVRATANTFYDFGNGQEALTKFVEHILLHEKFKYLKRKQEEDTIKNTLVHPNPGAIIELNATTFDNFTKSTKFFTFVLFYAPWCGACKEMMGELQAVANYFKLDKKVVIARINADDNPVLLDRYTITALPTMYMFPKARLAKRGIRYTSGRERFDMQAAIDTQNRMQDSEDQPYIDENTNMETLMAEMKAQGKDPETLMRRYAAKSGQEYKSPEGKEKS